MEFLPNPKQTEYHTGHFLPGPLTKILLCGTEPGAFLYAQMLQKELREEAGLSLDILRALQPTESGDIILCLDQKLEKDHYQLAVEEERILLAAGSDEAFCNGVQTLCQLIQLHGAVLPCLSITDWPDLQNRGYYMDCSRGRVPKLSYLKKVADLLCRFKVNQWQLYIEHTYLFRGLSEAWREDTPLTAEEIMELDAYCAARHIELVPSLSSFGHMYRILSTKTCCDLCELPDSEKIPYSYTYAGQHHTLNVSHPEALDFIKGLIDEYRPLFRTNKFNICADETFDLGKGRSKALAEEKGERQLYVEHVKALCEHLVAQGCVPMFWGDIMYRWPESCGELPKETICLNWGYAPDQPEDAIKAIAESGITQYACPGVCGWNMWMPLLDFAYRNNRAMCRHAHKYGAVGLLNTDWGDYGHVNDYRLSIPGILYGAAFSWNAEEVSFDEINGAISRLAYGDTSGKIVSAIAHFSDNEMFQWSQAVNWMEGDEARRAEILEERKYTKERAEKANREVKKALEEIYACTPYMSAGRKTVVQLFAVTGEGICIWNEIGAWLMDRSEEEGWKLAVRLENWLEHYRREWREISKESSLAVLSSMVVRYADLLRGRCRPAQATDPRISCAIAASAASV